MAGAFCSSTNEILNRRQMMQRETSLHCLFQILSRCHIPEEVDVAVDLLLESLDISRKNELLPTSLSILCCLLDKGHFDLQRPKNEDLISRLVTLFNHHSTRATAAVLSKLCKGLIPIPHLSKREISRTSKMQRMVSCSGRCHSSHGSSEAFHSGGHINCIS